MGISYDIEKSQDRKLSTLPRIGYFSRVVAKVSLYTYLGWGLITGAVGTGQILLEDISPKESAYLLEVTENLLNKPVQFSMGGYMLSHRINSWRDDKGRLTEKLNDLDLKKYSTEL